MTIADIINENLEFKYDIYELENGGITEDTKIDYSYKINFKEGSFEDEIKGEFLLDFYEPTRGSIEDNLRIEIVDRIFDLIIY